VRKAPERALDCAAAGETGPLQVPAICDGGSFYRALMAGSIFDSMLFHAAKDHLARRDLLAPEHVSLICDDPDLTFGWCEPLIAHIAWDHRPIIALGPHAGFSVGPSALVIVSLRPPSPLGWHGAGPLALKSAISFSDTPSQFQQSGAAGSGCLTPKPDQK